MSAITAINDKALLMRERVFAASELERILLMVHEERLTGVISLDVSQGALCSIRINEQQKLK